MRIAFEQPSLFKLWIERKSKGEPPHLLREKLRHMLPSHQLTWRCTGPVERLFSSGKGPFCTSMLVGGRVSQKGTSWASSLCALPSVQNPNLSLRLVATALPSLQRPSWSILQIPQLSQLSNSPQNWHGTPGGHHFYGDLYAPTRTRVEGVLIIQCRAHICAIVP